MAKIQEDIPKYLRSWSDQLFATSDQIRDVIGSRHWLSDGRHKERLLAEFLKKHLPSQCEVLTGFVTSLVDTSLTSREVDVLLCDGSVTAPIFRNGDLAVIPGYGLIAHIHVKSQLSRTSLADALQCAESVITASTGSGSNKNPCPCLYFFDADAEDLEHAASLFRNQAEILRKIITAENSEGLVFCAGRNLFGIGRKAIDKSPVRFVLFQINNMATAAFMANILSTTLLHITREHTQPSLLRAVTAHSTSTSTSLTIDL